MRLKEFLFGEGLTKEQYVQLLSAINFRIRKDGLNPQNAGEIIVGKTLIRQFAPRISAGLPDGCYYEARYTGDFPIPVTKYNGLYDR